MKKIAFGFIALSFVAFAIAVIYMLHNHLDQVRRHQQWERTTTPHLRQLMNCDHHDIPNSEWEFMVGWTMNLHSNLGGVFGNVDLDQAELFSQQLVRRQINRMTTQDIDWIWDEYLKFCKNSYNYDRYRPTINPDRKSAIAGSFGLSK